MKKIGIFFIILITLIGFFYIMLNPLRPISRDKTTQIFTVEIDNSDDDVVALKLSEQGFIRSRLGFDIALTLKNKHNRIQSGGYYLSKNMDTWKLIDTLTSGPKLKWVTIPEGFRKEQIGERLKTALGWSNQDLKNWNEIDTAMKYDYVEGVYFPDTYLIPVDEDGLLIAKRMINHFNDKFAPFLDQFAKKNIIWTTGLRMASIVQREGSGQSDMPLIAGILWNRLEKNQKLEIDATIQYAKGETNGNWWPPIFASDIQNINSPYNTYKHIGLPPHPISNPGLSAIEAVLNPADTKCLYYLHDHDRQIHCSETYVEHLKNIDKYLKQ